MDKILIAGYGWVGKAMKHLFPDAPLYDPLLGLQEEKDGWDCCFICVPTPMLENGKCDISVVEQTINEFDSKLYIIRSTVEIGTTDKLVKKYNKKIVFQPEYLGETVSHPFINMKDRPFMILGGTNESLEMATNIYKKVYNANVRKYLVTALEAEIIKYCENTAIGLKVCFANEIYNICKQFGVLYEKVQQGVFDYDPRMNLWFTDVYPDERGYGGKCLPKDINALTYACKESGYDPKLIMELMKYNDYLKKK